MKKVLILNFVFLFIIFAAALCSAAEGIHKGKVIYAKSVDKYTYIQLKEKSGKVWLAASKMDVSVGDTVEYVGGTLINDFKSKQLNRTFKSILFVARIHVVGKDKGKKLSIPNDEYHKNKNVVSKTNQVTSPKKGSLKKPSDGKTIEEIYSQKEKLAGKEVILRAKVIKVNKNIMKKNWLTLSDGTGKSPDDNITATTTDDVKNGDILVVKGILNLNVNIGSGYKYKMLIENAKLSK